MRTVNIRNLVQSFGMLQDMEGAEFTNALISLEKLGVLVTRTSTVKTSQRVYMGVYFTHRLDSESYGVVYSLDVDKKVVQSELSFNYDATYPHQNLKNLLDQVSVFTEIEEKAA